MLKTLISLIILANVLTAVEPENCNKDVQTLKQVFLIHRHGDRTPIDFYPRDPYRNSSLWPDGFGQLTKIGKNRMFELGKYLSSRYNCFLGSSPKEVYIRSSAENRCLESAALVLAGLYPPLSRWQWNNDLGKLWQPFPIKTVEFATDGMLNPGSRCRKAEKIMDDILHSKKVVDYYNKVKPTLEYAQDNTGIKKIDLTRAEELFDTLFIEKANNLKLPAWVDQTLFDQLEDIFAKTFIFSGMTREIQHFRAGLVLKDILENMLNTSNKYRLHIYSTHDTMLSVFLSALNAYTGIPPPFGASILLEVHQNQSHSPIINAYYLNKTESKSPYPLILKDCLRMEKTKSESESVCTVSNFHLSVQDLIPHNWEVECENIITNNVELTNLYILMSAFAITVFVLNIFIYLFFYKRRHRNQYRMLPTN